MKNTQNPFSGLFLFKEQCYNIFANPLKGYAQYFNISARQDLPLKKGALPVLILL